MASRDVKGFYKQTKKSKVIVKPSSASSKKRAGKGGGGATAIATTPSTLAVDLGEDDKYGGEEEEEEERLRQFDMDMRYGPCIGMSRLQRWNRASAIGLHPPPDVRDILERLYSKNARGPGSKPELLECLWHDRV